MKTSFKIPYHIKYRGYILPFLVIFYFTPYISLYFYFFYLLIKLSISFDYQIENVNNGYKFEYFDIFKKIIFFLNYFFLYYTSIIFNKNELLYLTQIFLLLIVFFDLMESLIGKRKDKIISLFPFYDFHTTKIYLQKSIVIIFIFNFFYSLKNYMVMDFNYFVMIFLHSVGILLQIYFFGVQLKQKFQMIEKIIDILKSFYKTIDIKKMYLDIKNDKKKNIDKIIKEYVDILFFNEDNLEIENKNEIVDVEF